MMASLALPRSAWSLLLLLIPAWIAYSNVVSISGLFLWVIIPSLVAVQVMLIMVYADRRLIAGVVLALLALASGGLSQLIGGNTSGSITRSTIMMTCCAGLMVLLWRTRWPATATLVCLAALSGAIGLGAAHRTVWLVPVWVVAAAAYLAAVGPLRSEDLRERGRLQSFSALLLAAGLVASLAGNAVYQVMRDPWVIASIGPKALGATAVTGTSDMNDSPAGPVEFSVKVRGSGKNMSKRLLPLPPPGTVLGSASGMSEYRPAEVPRYVPPAQAPATPRNPATIAALSVASLLALLALVVATWAAVVGLKWVLLRRRLRSGSPAEEVAGAWHWLRLRWARSGYFEYVNLSPDRISRLTAGTGEPELAELAAAATRALYAGSPDLDTVQATRAWHSAATLAASHTGGFRNRLRSLLITPVGANQRMACRERTPAPMDTDIREFVSRAD